MTAVVLGCAAVTLILGGVVAIAWSLAGRRCRHDRPARPLSLRERARWRHITRTYARGAELDELRARIALLEELELLEQGGSEDLR